MNDLFSSQSFKKYQEVNGAGGDIESGDAARSEGVNLDKFFEEVEGVKTDMGEVEKLYKQLQQANEDCKTAHNANTMKDLRSKMDKDITQVLKRVKLIKGKLEALDKSNADARKVPGCGPGSSADRTRTSVVSGLGKKLKTIMDDFQVIIRISKKDSISNVRTSIPHFVSLTH